MARRGISRPGAAKGGDFGDGDGPRKARAERTTAPPALPRARGGRTAGGSPGIAERLSIVEKERDALRAELVRAQTRIEELERRQAELADRIAWALDSVHSLMQDEG